METQKTNETNKRKKVNKNEEKEKELEVSDLQSLLKRISIPQSLVVNVYLFGSSAYGNTTSASDKDIILVAKEELDKKTTRKWKDMEWLHAHGWLQRLKDTFKDCRRDFIGYVDFQCWIYSPKTFQILLNNYVPFAVECMFLPKENVWMQMEEFHMPNPLDHASLSISYKMVAEAHFERAKLEFGDHHEKSQIKRGRFAKGRGELKLKTEPWNLYQSKKTLFHALRILEFGCQLVEHGKIKDLSAANQSKQMLLNVPGEEWDSHLAVFLPLYESALERFNYLVSGTSKAE